MAVNRLIIVASIEGVKNVTKQISGIGDAAAGAQRQSTLLGKSLGALIVGGSLSLLASYTDEFINLENKLRTVTTSTEQLTEVTQRLFDIAQETRVSFSSTASLYQRLAMAGKQYGWTTESNLKFTELLNKATIISGATTTEANAAIIQLSQGMSKGVLNGDELRSVLEQLPIVGDAIAKQMGVTRGELRGLGADGAITSDIVMQAVLGMEEWNEQFAKLTPTMSQAFQVLNDSVMMFLGQVNKGTGGVNIFTNIILGAAQVIKTAAVPATELLSAVMGGLYAIGLALWSPIEQVANALLTYALGAEEASNTSLTMLEFVKMLTEGFIFMLKTALLPVTLAIQGVAWGLNELGIISDEAYKNITDVTYGLKDWVKDGLAANKRIAGVGEALDETTDSAGSFGGALSKVTDELEKNGKAAKGMADEYLKMEGYLGDAANGTSMLDGSLGELETTTSKTKDSTNKLKESMWDTGIAFDDTSDSVDNYASSLSGLLGLDGQVYNGLNGIASGLAGVTAAANNAANAIKNVSNATSTVSGGNASTLYGSSGGTGFGVVSGSTGKPIEARASGGSVRSGTPYLVGEKGPEIMIPGQNGSVLPNELVNPYLDKLAQAKADLQAFHQSQIGTMIGGNEINTLVSLQRKVQTVTDMMNDYQKVLDVKILKYQSKLLKQQVESQTGQGPVLPGFEPSAAPQIDFQTLTPWQSGTPAGPDNNRFGVAGGGSGSSDNSINVVVNFSTDDYASFRQNRAQFEEELRATVERAARRKGRR